MTFIVSSFFDLLCTCFATDFGFYKGAIAEVISSRYRTVAKIGKGVFSTVFRCIDMNTTNEVAVKVLRNKENSSSNTDAILLAKEVRIIQALQRVPTKATGIIQIFDTFEHSGHRLGRYSFRNIFCLIW